VAENSELLQNFRFKVTLTRNNPGEGPATLGDGFFSECSGLELEADIKEYLEGGRNDGVVRRVGRVKLVPLVVKRGMFLPEPGGTAESSLWTWLTDTVGGVRPVRRYDGEVEVQDASGGRVVARWSFDRALPSKVTGPALNAITGAVAIEEMHMVHEGLRLVTPT
jgi:phage tail-like protein